MARLGDKGEKATGYEIEKGDGVLCVYGVPSTHPRTVTTLSLELRLLFAVGGSSGGSLSPRGRRDTQMD